MEDHVKMIAARRIAEHRDKPAKGRTELLLIAERF